MFVFKNVQCLRVIDGDTIVCQILLTPDSLTIKKKIRLARIDTPELNEPRGKEIRSYLKSMIQNKKLNELVVNGMDGWGRWIAEVEYCGINISDFLLENKMAVPYKK